MTEALRYRDSQIPVKGVLSNLDEFKRKEAENIGSYNLLMIHTTRLTVYAEYRKSNYELIEVLMERI
jgi:hypothetical protein